MKLLIEWRPGALILGMLLAGEAAIALLNEQTSYADLASLPVVVLYRHIDVKMGIASRLV